MPALRIAVPCRCRHRRRAHGLDDYLVRVGGPEATAFGDGGVALFYVVDVSGRPPPPARFVAPADGGDNDDRALQRATTVSRSLTSSTSPVGRRHLPDASHRRMAATTTTKRRDARRRCRAL